MTLRHLKIFVTVCECGGVTRAAETLHMVQPSVSYAIAEMEKYYNLVLFDRINQRLVLTDIGRELLVKAKDLLSGFDDFEQLAMKGSQHPVLRIGSSLTLGQTVLPRFLKDLSVVCPEAVPSVMINKTSFVVKALEEGNLDFIMVEGEITSTRLRTFPFGGDHLVVVCAFDYDMPDRLTLEELIAYPLLLREMGSASRSQLEHQLALNHLSVKPFLESAGNECVLSSAAAGLGVAILPDRLVEPFVRRRVLRIVTVEGTDFCRTHFLAVHKNRKMNAVQNRAFELCRSFSAESEK